MKGVSYYFATCGLQGHIKKVNLLAANRSPQPTIEISPRVAAVQEMIRQKRNESAPIDHPLVHDITDD